MRHIPVNRLEEGMEIKQFFLLRKREERLTRKGDPFWEVLLGDASGTVTGKVWADALPRCRKEAEPGQVVGVQATVQVYQEEPQLVIRYLAEADHIKAQGGDVTGLDMADLLPASPFDVNVMWEELRSTVEKELSREQLRDLLLFLLSEHEAALKQAPAALLYHHSYLGGLLEHTLTLLKSVLAWHDWEGKGDRDVLIAGAILHDIGKILEIEGLGAYEKTREGRLLGHLIQGRDLLRDAARQRGFGDHLLLTHLEHIILSHHGALEFGSPVVPKTREAFIIHSLDDLNAKLKMIDDEMEKPGRGGEFTDYHRVLRRKFFTGS